MHRKTVYANSTPLETDILLAGRFAMAGLGYLIQDLAGANTFIAGAVAAPTSPASMAVTVGLGRIYSPVAIDTTAWSSLAVDATVIMKQGTLTAPVTLACPAPLTSGQSINYLIEGQYQDIDSDLVTLLYFNSTNPQQPFSGAGNNGLAQPTTRAGKFVVQVKVGLPATTGSQVTPTVDSGWTAMYVVTVAFGATTITTGNIVTVTNAPFVQPNMSGSFTLTGTGFSGTAPAVTVLYRTSGALATLIIPSLTGTSNATGFTGTGLPAALQPVAGLSTQLTPVAAAANNSAAVAGAYASISAGSGTITFDLVGGSAAWTASGSKSIAGVLNYALF